MGDIQMGSTTPEACSQLHSLGNSDSNCMGVCLLTQQISKG